MAGGTPAPMNGEVVLVFSNLRWEERKEMRGEGWIKLTRVVPLGVVGAGLQGVGAPDGVFEVEVRGSERRDGRCEEESC